nr:unnamed protein product [Callosobruchus analis]
MAPPKKHKKNAECSEVEIEQLDDASDASIGNKLSECLSKSFENFNVSLNQTLTNNFETMMQSFACQLNNNLTLISQNLTDLSSKIDVNQVSKVDDPNVDCYTKKEDTQAHAGGINSGKQRECISTWKDLGGLNLHFLPNGQLHPMVFINKLTSLLDEAGVPPEKRLYFGTNCLRGSAQDWAEIKGFTSFSDFKEKFIKRYWSTDKEREMLSRIKFGEYEGGSRADYFLKLIRESRYLSKSIEEDELLEMCIAHFPPEVRRGLMNSGYRNVEDVEHYLRKLDRLEEEVADTRSRNRGSGSNNNRDIGRQNPYRDNVNQNTNWRHANRNENRNARHGDNEQRQEVSTVFNKDVGDLLEEKPEVQTVSVMPVVWAKFENTETQCLVDSGSQVTGVSEKYLAELSHRNEKIPRIPCKCVTLMGAMGSKSTMVKEQVYLTFELGGREFEYSFLVIPGLVRNVILGCDWMHDHGIKIDFGQNKLCGQFMGKNFEYSFNCEPKLDSGLMVSEVLMDDSHHIWDTNTKVVKEWYPKEEIERISDKAEGLSSSEKNSLCSLLLEYQPIFSDQPGLIKCYQHKIVMHDGTPFVQNGYPIPRVYRDEVRRQVQEMIDWGVVEPSQTEYISPLVVEKLSRDYFIKIGKPQAVLTDNGTQFSNPKWGHYLSGQGIAWRHTSVYFPQGNPTERVNREIGRIIRTLCYKQHTKWAYVLKDVQGWLNRVVHSGTNYTPQYLHFGITPKNTILSEVSFPPPSFLEERDHQVRIELAYRNLKTRAEKRQRRHDMRHRVQVFDVGDKVLVRTHHQSSAESAEVKKFFLLFRGPATIVKIQGHNSYEVVEDATGINLGVHNVYDLKPYKVPPCQL